MSDYIERSKAAEILCKMICGNERGLCVSKPESCWHSRMIDLYNIEPADISNVKSATPIRRLRPSKYVVYKPSGLHKNGEVLYLKRVFVNENNYATYCPVCSKRLCSRFDHYCPNCGTKMD